MAFQHITQSWGYNLKSQAYRVLCMQYILICACVCVWLSSWYWIFSLSHSTCIFCIPDAVFIVHFLFHFHILKVSSSCHVPSYIHPHHTHHIKYATHDVYYTAWEVHGVKCKVPLKLKVHYIHSAIVNCNMQK